MTIAVFGNFGVKNIGDDLILKGLLEEFKNHELIVFCGNPKQIIEQFSLQSYQFFVGGIRSFFRYLFSSSYRAEIRESYRALLNSDCILIGGGGILVDRSLNTIFLWWRQLSVIRKTKKPYEFIANSFELKHWWTKKLFFPFLKNASKITVRDSVSKAFIESLSLKADLVPDLSYICDLSCYSTKNPTNRSAIALALCKSGLSKRAQRSLRHFIVQKKKEGYEIIGLAFQTICDDDRKILKAIDSEIRIESDLSNVLEELSKAKLLIGMRLHSIMLAHRFQVPMIAIAYQEKITAFMKDQGKASDTIAAWNVTPKILQEIFQAVLKRSV